MLNWANFGVDAQGRCCTSFNAGAHGFSNFIYSTNDAKTWYDAVIFQVNRNYRPGATSRDIAAAHRPDPGIVERFDEPVGLRRELLHPRVITGGDRGLLH